MRETTHKTARQRKAGRRHPLATVALIAIGLGLTGGAYAVKNFGRKEMTSSIVISYYWHFVDVVWIGLFATIYLIK